MLFYGVCEEPQVLYLVTELMEGGDLYHLLHEGKINLSAKQRKDLALDITSGLCFLHRQNPLIVHGDLKSMNILVIIKCLDVRLLSNPIFCLAARSKSIKCQDS